MSLSPRIRYGQRVTDEWRGKVKIVGLSYRRITWPIGNKSSTLLPGLVMRGDGQTILNFSQCSVW